MKKTLGIFGLLAGIFVLTGLLQPAFLHPQNLKNLAQWSGLFGILALAASFVIITGGIDLSIGSLVGLCGSLVPFLLLEQGWSQPATLLLVLCICVGIGLFHGFMITKLKLWSFIVTLCGLFIYRGLAKVIIGNQSVGYRDQFTGLRSLSESKLFGTIPMPFVILLGLGILAALFLNKTVYGRYMLALGRNEDAARFSGVHTDRVKILAYVLCSVLSGFGGLLFSLDINSMTPTSFGSFYELYAIAGAVLGGCSLRGGEGTITGVICGATLVEVIKNAVTLLGVQDEAELLVIGLVILVGVTIDEVFKRLVEKRRAIQQVSVKDT
jgi:ribose transport system permease protein